jgi:hypothetical protein
MAVDDPASPSGRGTPAGSHHGSEAVRLVADERLPCGRLVSAVWQQVRARTDQADRHTSGCPFCRQAAEGLAALDSTTRTLRAQHPSARTVADRVVRAVRAEARLGAMLPLDDPGHDLRIAETTAAKILRRAADGVPGVRAASCRLVPDGGGRTTVAVAMTLAATVDRPLPPRAVEVRTTVAHAARRSLGLAVSAIDLAIVSVLEPSDATDPGEPAPGSGGRG